LSPETTEGKQGFIHPFEVNGSVAEAQVRLILRSFTTEDLPEYASLLRRIGDDVVRLMPGLECEVESYRQYRNMASGLAKLPLAVDLAEEAFKNLGRPVSRTIVRGGTDGSLLTEKGLPTPNLSSGQHNIHSLKEFACLDQMVEGVEHLVELADLWQQRSRV
jgi:tripeptide aminopeptidase